MGRLRTVEIPMFDLAKILEQFRNPMLLKTELPPDLRSMGVWVEPYRAQIVATFESSTFDDVPPGEKPPTWNLEWMNWDVPLPATPRDQILEEVGLERARQQEQWGTDDHSISEWMLIIRKHVGRLAYYALEWGTTNYPNDIPSDLRKQAIKVAALCVALIEDWCVKLEGFGKKW